MNYEETYYFDVVTGFGTGFDEHDIQILGKSFTFFCCDLPAKQYQRENETCLFSDKSVLFPTSMMITSLPRSLRTSSIHRAV